MKLFVSAKKFSLAERKEILNLSRKANLKKKKKLLTNQNSTKIKS